MPFRDDDEARLARLANLERENEELREKLEAEQRRAGDLRDDRDREREKREDAEREQRALREQHEQAKREQREQREREQRDAREQREQAKRAKREASARSTGWRWSKVSWALPIAGIVVALFVVPNPRCRALTGERSIKRILAVGEIVSVQVMHERRRSATRTELINFEAGTWKRLGSLELGKVDQVPVPPAGDRVWVTTADKELALVDLRAPAVIVSADELPTRVPELASGYRLGDLSDARIHAPDGSIADEITSYQNSVPVVLADGTRA